MILKIDTKNPMAGGIRIETVAEIASIFETLFLRNLVLCTGAKFDSRLISNKFSAQAHLQAIQPIELYNRIPFLGNRRTRHKSTYLSHL